MVSPVCFALFLLASFVVAPAPSAVSYNAASQSISIRLPCESGWTWFAPSLSCYKVRFAHSKDLAQVGYQANYEQGESECQKSQAHLTSVMDDTENEFLSDLARSGYEESIVKRPGWRIFQGAILLGLRRKSLKSSWEWADGSRVTYTKFHKEEPTNLDNELCGLLVPEKMDAITRMYRQWADVYCNETMRAFVCKKPATLPSA